ncbi:Fe2+-dependent dioxygenase [Bosea sp. TAF32]|uniref:Fe2+-dependent dioxygenase n=1 Tax=Bosea sp. TAF32 TaxID=3237482 RepID=UPI003F93CE18
MLVHIPGLLTSEEVQHCRSVLEASAWTDGSVTAGEQARKVKNNLQLPVDSPQARELGQIVLHGLGRNATFTSAAMPLRVLPPMFNRYDIGMRFGSHVDAAVRSAAGGARMRADISSTLFLTPPEDYDGGELVIEDTYGTREVKLPAGDLIVYPTTCLHSVNEITRGSRWASFFWTQSMIKDEANRGLLHQLDLAIIRLRQDLPDDHPSVLTLANTYHNLLRQWADI